MTWDQLMGKIREGLTESGARIRVLGELLAETSERSELFDVEVVRAAFIMLALTLSDLHSVIEHVTIGLDAVVGAYREEDKAQEVKGDGAKSA